jgi:hypothetical protein
VADGASSPQICGDLPTLGPYCYNDPTLGEISSKQEREDKMKRAGLKEWSEHPALVPISEERKYIKRNSGKGDKEAKAELHKLTMKAGDTRKKEITKEHMKKNRGIINAAVEKAYRQTDV